MNENKVLVKKLASSGKVDDVFSTCKTISNLKDLIYDGKGSG